MGDFITEWEALFSLYRHDLPDETQAKLWNIKNDPTQIGEHYRYIFFCLVKHKIKSHFKVTEVIELIDDAITACCEFWKNHLIRDGLDAPCLVSEKEMEICHYITGDTISVHYDLLSPTNGHREGKYADREFVYRHIKEAFDPKNIFPILLEQPKIQHIQYKKIPTYLWVTCRPPSGKFDTEDCITNLACEDQELCSTELVHELGICHDGKCNEQILFRIVPPTHPPALYKPNWLVAKANPQWKPSPHEDHGKTRHLSTGEDCYREWIACPQEWFGEGQEGASPTLKAVIVSPHPIGSMNIAPYMMGR